MSLSTISEPWSTNPPSRRTKEQMAELRYRIYRLLEERHPMTCRQLFYQMVSAEMIPKTEASYKNIVVRLCGEMREEDELPWEWLADSTRWMHKPDSYSSLEQAIARTLRPRHQSGHVTIKGTKRKYYYGEFNVYVKDATGKSIRKHRGEFLGYKSEMTKSAAE